MYQSYYDIGAQENAIMITVILLPTTRKIFPLLIAKPPTSYLHPISVIFMYSKWPQSQSVSATSNIASETYD